MCGFLCQELQQEALRLMAERFDESLERRACCLCAKGAATEGAEAQAQLQALYSILYDRHIYIFCISD